MIFSGGIPLRRGGAMSGAIGVSGGGGDQDQGYLSRDRRERR
jgi:uncharacterized protein GlcG (DUF336 family)